MPRAGDRVQMLGLAATSLLLAAQAAAASPAAQATNKPHADCNKTAATTYEITMCFHGDHVRAEKRMNRAYRAVLSRVEGEERAKLEASQRAWMRYREADCDFYARDGGSLEDANLGACRGYLDNVRAKDLEDWLANDDYVSDRQPKEPARSSKPGPQ